MSAWRQFLCRFGIHAYRTVAQTGLTAYLECADCGKRAAPQGGGGYQPIDHEWLAGSKPTPMTHVSELMAHPPGPARKGPTDKVRVQWSGGE